MSRAADQAAPKRGRGRPSIGERIEVRLPEAVHAELSAEAERRGVPLAGLVRDLLALAVERLRQSPPRRRQR